MERLQGHINQMPRWEQMNLGCLEQESVADYSDYGTYMVSDHHHQMPFLHMLLEDQGGQQPAPSEPSSFQLLLQQQEERLHHHHQQLLQDPRLFPFRCSGDPWPPPENDSSWPRPLSLELDSCVTHASESLSDAMNHHHYEHENHDQQLHHPQHQQRKQPPSRSFKREPCPGAEPAPKTSSAGTTTPVATEPASAVEKRKRKRPRRLARNVEEVESQRMTHIAVERNRRKLMNDHLGCLRALMPPSLVQRGDQASVIGGAIDFVKELEQLLQSLEAEKRRRALRSAPGGAAGPPTAAAAPFHDFFTTPQYTTYTSPGPSSTPSSSSSTSSSSPAPTCPLRAVKAEGQAGVVVAGAADVEATVVQTHVNLRVLTPRRPAQLLRAIAALEELHLSALHLNITTLDDSVLYSLNLKIEEECKLGSADEIATATHQIFSLINSTS